MTFKFRCKRCDEIHEGVPTFGFDSPAIAQWIPEGERGTRIELGSDDCVVDGERFLVRGCLEIPVEGEDDPFIWGVWVDISQRDFEAWERSFHLDERAHIGPFAGYLGSCLPGYPDTLNLHVVMRLRNHGTRPCIEVSPSEHPLHQEQCQGIDQDRLAEIYETVMHGSPGAASH